MRRLLLLLVMLAFAAGCAPEKVQPVPLEKVPEKVMKVAREKLPNVKFDSAWMTRKGNYEVRGKTPEGKTRDIQITPDGEVVEID
jgi:hypothetical protein